MRLSSLLSAALLGLASASEDITLFSDGKISPCHNSTNQINATTFTAGLTPSNRTLSFAFSGTSQVQGNDTIGLAIFANDKQVHQTVLDPCTLMLPDLCPLSTGPFDIPMANVAIPEKALAAFQQSNVKAAVHFRLNISSVSGGWHESCVRVGLYNKTEAAQNSTSGNGTHGTNGTSGSNSTGGGSDKPGSGASFLQMNWILALLALGACLL